MWGAWTLVMPLKRLAEAKSRLRGALPGVSHPDLVLALALDTLDAALRCTAVGRVLVVTSDDRAAAVLAARGGTVLRDRTSGLNPALAWAAGTVPAHTPVAAITADLPALRPADLAYALRRPEPSGDAARPQPPGASVRPQPPGDAARPEPPGASVRPHRWFVPDAAGTGTTLLAVTAGALDPRFGAGSAQAHRTSGAVPVPTAGASLRRDVDTPADLRAVLELGAGTRTRALGRAAGMAAGGVGGRRAVKYGVSMQGTVAAYDADTRSGSVLLDDGHEIAFSAAAFDASGLRQLRFGQRVQLEVDTSGTVTLVNIPTLM